MKSWLIAALTALAWSSVASALDYPSADRKPVVDTYHGTSVSDDYPWLEQSADPATQSWLASENQISRQYLDAIPGRNALRDRIAALLKSNSNSYGGVVERGGIIYALKVDPSQQQPMLVTLKSVDDVSGERVVVDPNTLSGAGSVAIDFFVPSNDGKKVAVSLSLNGSEDGTLHVFDAATGKALPDEIPRSSYATAGGSLAWNRDGSGFAYTRYPAPGERGDADIHFYQQVWFHRLGTPSSTDTYETGKQFPRIAEIALSSTRDGRAMLARVANGDGGDASFYLKTGKAWRPIAADADGVKQARFGDDGWVYLLSRKAAPRGKLLRLPQKQPMLSNAQVVLPEGEGTIENFEIAGGRAYVSILVGGPSRLVAIDLASRRVSDIELPPISGVQDLVRIGAMRVVAQVSNFVLPTAWYTVQPAKAPVKTAMAMTSNADYGDTEVVREFATGKDGTKIPMSILRRKGTKLDGNNPTLLYAYGGFDVSMTPDFRSTRSLWLSRGGVFVVANLRGGGEYGEEWHTAGNLTHKQTVFDDYIACAQYLIQKGYTRPDRLAAQGGSNGGLTMGAVLTQRPDLFRAIDSEVGIYDMLRVELDPNGAFNVTEFGTVKDRSQFDALYAYSPYHHVKDGTGYPAVFMSTGDNDGRVNPAQSRKMIARLQAADPHGKPILLRTSATAGHGIGTSLSEAIEQLADEYVFLMNELGMSIEGGQ